MPLESAYVLINNKARVHGSLGKDAPLRRALEHLGAITSHHITSSAAFISNIAESKFSVHVPAPKLALGPSGGLHPLFGTLRLAR